MSASQPVHFTTRGTVPNSSLGAWVSPRSSLDAFREDKCLSSLLGIELRLFGRKSSSLNTLPATKDLTCNVEVTRSEMTILLMSPFLSVTPN